MPKKYIKKYFIMLFIVLIIQMGITLQAGIGIFTYDNDKIILSKSNNSLVLIKEDAIIALSQIKTEQTQLLDGLNQVWLKFKSNIIVKNLSNKSHSVQLGFPLCNNPKTAKDYERSTLINTISKNAPNYFDFKVANREKHYSTKFFSEDKQKKYIGIFTWEMSFTANETKTFTVSYFIPLLHLGPSSSSSMCLQGTTLERYNTTELLYGKLSTCERLEIDYVIAHDSFSQRIKPKTYLQIKLKRIIDKLCDKDIYWDRGFKYIDMLYPKFPYILTVVYPTPSDSNDSTLFWMNVDTSCKIEIIKTHFSRRKKEMNNLLDSFVREMQYLLNGWITVYRDNVKTFNGEIKKSYLRKLENMERLKKYPHLKKDLQDICLEFYGKKTNNVNIQSFLKKQIWYNAQKKMFSGYLLIEKSDDVPQKIITE